MQPTQNCKNCGNLFTGKFCNQCGEKVYTEKDKKLSHIFEETFHFITHFEGSLFRTLKTIVTKPGRLSLNYCNGIRKKYFKPVSLFLLSVVIYLVFPVFHGLNMKLGTYINQETSFYRLAAPVVTQKMKARSVNYETIRKEYDEKSLKIAKVFLFVLLPLGALVLWVLFFTKRRFYFDHFIMATEFISVKIMLIFLLLPFIMWIGMQFDPDFHIYFEEANRILRISVMLVFLLFLISAFRKFYTQNWFWTISKAILFLGIFEFYITFLYHLLLFYIVMLFI